MKIRVFLNFLIILGLLIITAGCIDESAQSGSAPVTPTPVVTKYKAGDVIAKSSATTTGVVAVQSYDPAKDSYLIYDVSKTQTAQWEKIGNSGTRPLPRTATEKLYPVKVGSTGSSQSVAPRSTNSGTYQNSLSPTPTIKKDTQDYTFVETITYTTDTGRTIITKNKILKTATIEMSIMNQKSEYPGINELGTKIACGMVRLAFFNETAKEEFNKQVQQWNSQQYTVTDDSPQEQKVATPGENPLEGYKVTSARIQIKDQATNNQISECTVTGPNIADVAVTMY
jgi:hypothetical protein